MCTLTWIRTADGFELFSSRDELRTRLAARPPEAAESSPRRGRRASALYPRDGDAGGTWIAVNDLGLALAVLNLRGPDADAPDPGGTYTSRGRLPLELLGAADVGETRSALESLELERFRGFHLVAADASGRIAAWRWDRASLSDERLEQPLPECAILTSSAYEEVHEARRSTFDRALARAGGAVDRALLEELHRSHEPIRGRSSICMHREDARTVSLSHVTVGEERVSFRYLDGSPCTGSFAPPLHLARRGKEER